MIFCVAARLLAASESPDNDLEYTLYVSIAADSMGAFPNVFELPDQPPPFQYGYGFSSDDFWPFPGWHAHDGETAGFDTFMTVDPRDAHPGKDEVHFHDGTHAPNSIKPDASQPGDRYFLGDHSKTYYTGRDGVKRDRDFVYIEHFAVGASRIYLHGSPEDYVAVDVSTPYAGTALFLKKGDASAEDDDFMAVFLDVSSADIPLTSDHFEYATAPSPTAGVPSGFDQIQTATVDVWPALDLDDAGNIYVTFRSPGIVEPNANPGNGSDLVAMKYSPQGDILWQGNYGDGKWMGEGRTSRIFDSVYDNGFYYLGVFICNSSGRGEFQVAKIDASDGRQVGLFEYDPGFGVDNVTGITRDNDGHLYLSGSSSSSVNEGPGPFWLKIDQEQIGSGSSGLVGFVDGGVEGTFYHEGHGGVAFFPSGSAPGEGLVANAGWNYEMRNHHAMWLRIWDSLGNLEDIVDLTGGSDYPGWAFQVAFDSQGYIYVAGVVHGPLSEFPAVPYSGNADVFVVKVHPSTRTVIDAALIGSDWSDEAIDMAIDAQDHIYLAGHTYGSLFRTNPREGGYADGIVIKLDSDLNLLAGQQLGTDREDHFTSLQVKDDVVYVAGFTEGSLVEPIDTANYNTDVVLLALDADSLNPLPRPRASRASCWMMY